MLNYRPAQPRDSVLVDDTTMLILLLSLLMITGDKHNVLWLPVHKWRPQSPRGFRVPFVFYWVNMCFSYSGCCTVTFNNNSIQPKYRETGDRVRGTCVHICMNTLARKCLTTVDTNRPLSVHSGVTPFRFALPASVHTRHRLHLEYVISLSRELNCVFGVIFTNSF